MTIRNLHFVSHTHWDREWYLTYQQFRLKLVHLMDNLLALLNTDPGYQHFMLDGQTIVLDDYLSIRPENELEIRKFVQNGRLLIGPWYTMPDEFLVSPEAITRNLLQGSRATSRFGLCMKVGYIPDTFGHIGQMPQILRGFGIDKACVQRGLSDEPCELWWEGPDGSRVLLAYLRNGYSNAAGLPTLEPDRFITEIDNLVKSLLPYTATDQILLMHGTDHMEPPWNTSHLIAYAKSHLKDYHSTHSTLPVYLNTVQSFIQNNEVAIPTVKGELRSPKRHPLLTGVLSTRIWIKQRNHACESLLEKWAEPFSTWANYIKDPTRGTSQSLRPLPELSNNIINPAPILQHAWRILMECQSHDSICGCSIDQVYEEMRPRFDQVEQIGEEITRQSLEVLSASINTTHNKLENGSFLTIPIIVFNPNPGPRTDYVTLKIDLPSEVDHFEIIDENEVRTTYQITGSDSRELINVVMDRAEIIAGLAMIHDGRVAGMVIRSLNYRREGDQLHIDVELVETGEPDISLWNRGMQEFNNLTADMQLNKFVIHARSPAVTSLMFIARDVPAFGYRTYWLRGFTPSTADSKKLLKLNRAVQILMPIARRITQLSFVNKRLSQPRAHIKTDKPYLMTNEFFIVEASPRDGTLTITDQRSGMTYPGLNRIVDGGDCGDEYNFSPPFNDTIISPSLQDVQIIHGSVQLILHLTFLLKLPRELSPDRHSRSRDHIYLPIQMQVTLTKGVPRVDIHADIENYGRDHRLRVHFPVPFKPYHVYYDGHFEILERGVHLPIYDDAWVEQPRPERPQRLFTDVTDGVQGLMIANRGLPEIEVSENDMGNTEIMLTLLRCVGWLSRDDTSTRKGHAGPMIPTPGAQLPGTYSFDYAIIPHSGSATGIFPSTLPLDQAWDFNNPLRAVSTSIHNGQLPCSNSFIRTLSTVKKPYRDKGLPNSPEMQNLYVISTVKTAEDGSGCIVRGYNIGPELLEVTLVPWRYFDHAEKLNLSETTVAVLNPGSDGEVTFPVRQHEIVTVKFMD